MTHTPPLRVTLVIGTAAAGGAEGQLVRLAGELIDRGLAVNVLFIAGGGPLTKVLDDRGVPWEVLYRTGLPSMTTQTLLSYVRLARRLRQTQPDIVFAWLGGAIWKSLPLAALRTRAKRIAGFRGEVRNNELGRLGRILHRAVSRADAVTINAPSLYSEAVRWGADPAKVHFIPNGVEIPIDTASVRVDPPVAVVVANFRWYKGHDVLVEALAKIQTPLVVRLVGEGSERAVTERSVIEGQLQDRVQFVAVPADVRAELHHAQFAIHPSRTEGLSNAILEEMSHGLPVVATEVGGTPLLIEDSVNGYLVPAGDADMLAKRIEELAQSAELRQLMSEAARAKAEEFGWSTCAEAYIALFERLVRDGKAAS